MKIESELFNKYKYLENIQNNIWHISIIPLFSVKRFYNTYITNKTDLRNIHN